MDEKYVPKVQEAAIPEEGEWIRLGTEWALALSIPEWKDIVQASSEGYRYLWMYDRYEKAYLFSFRLKDQMDRAVAFPHNHAGALLQDERARHPFGIVITGGALAEEDASYLLLRGVHFKRHPGETER